MSNCDTCIDTFTYLVSVVKNDYKMSADVHSKNDSKPSIFSNFKLLVSKITSQNTTLKLYKPLI